MKRTILIPAISFIVLTLVPDVSISDGKYVGVDECKTCHGNIYASWKNDAHSSVFVILEEGEAQENTNCLPCHTTGFTLAEDDSATYEEKDVTCENCHGPGSAHVLSRGKSAIDRGNNEEVCINCHESSWSPAFDFDEYINRGVH